jgi:integrase
MYRYMMGGRARTMGLGPLRLVSLAMAREQALELAKEIRQGRDPLNKPVLVAEKPITFQECAGAFISAQRAGWRNEKHAAQWETTTATYCFATIGTMPVQSIGTDEILAILEPIWMVKPETASRVRARIENILDWATARNMRTGENPARWRGHLDKLLPAKTKVRKVRHHPALPYSQINEFFEAIDVQDGCAVTALKFCILTATRTGEALGARWSEIDLENALWTIPSDRMKAGKEHRVPLSGSAVAILRGMAVWKASDFVFPGSKQGAGLSNMAMAQVLKRAGYRQITVHGFRSTFRDWAAEKTDFANEVVEMALAHTVSNKVEAAYRRGDMLERRRRLMTDWAGFCMS